MPEGLLVTCEIEGAGLAQGVRSPSEMQMQSICHCPVGEGSKRLVGEKSQTNEAVLEDSESHLPIAFA